MVPRPGCFLEFQGCPGPTLGDFDVIDLRFRLGVEILKGPPGNSLAQQGAAATTMLTLTSV